MTSLTCRHQPSRQRASRVGAAGYRPEINQKWKSPALFLLYIIPLNHFPLCRSDYWFKAIRCNLRIPIACVIYHKWPWWHNIQMDFNYSRLTKSQFQKFATRKGKCELCSHWIISIKLVWFRISPRTPWHVGCHGDKSPVCEMWRRLLRFSIPLPPYMVVKNPSLGREATWHAHQVSRSLSERTHTQTFYPCYMKDVLSSGKETPEMSIHLADRLWVKGWAVSHGD